MHNDQGQGQLTWASEGKPQSDPMIIFSFEDKGKEKTQLNKQKYRS